MSRNMIGICGVVILLVGVFLPFMGLEQSDGDILPLLLSVICFCMAGGLFFLAIKPQWFKRYVLTICALFMFATLVFTAGFFLRIGGAGIANRAVGPINSQSKAERVDNRTLIQALSGKAQSLTSNNQDWNWYVRSGAIKPYEELSKRFKAGQLSESELNDVVELALSEMETLQQHDSPEPEGLAINYYLVTPAREIIGSAYEKERLTPLQQERLCKILFGSWQTLTVPSRVTRGELLSFELSESPSYNGGVPCNERSFREMPRATAVSAVRLNGETVPLLDDEKHFPREQWSKADFVSFASPGGGAETLRGRLRMDFEPGNYELTFVLDSAVFEKDTVLFTPEDHAAGFYSQLGQAHRWPPALHRFTREMAVPLTIEAD